jgi:signal transduction histidine kinase
MPGSPTPRLLAGLAATLVAIALFSWYTLRQIEGLRLLQTETVERNRKDSLQLLRIQSNLNSLGLAIRDVVEGRQGYPIPAYRSEFDRIRFDLNDALQKESQLASRPGEQNSYLQQSVAQFWESVDQARALKMMANSLTAQQASLSSTVSRLLVQNHEAEEQAARAVEHIYKRVERNIYVFLFAMLAGIAAIGVFVAASNRALFQQLAQVSEQRSTLSRKLIGLQEEIFRSVSRELHDDFGQILTAIGTMLRRAEKKGLPPDSPFADDIAEVRQVVQETLEKTRSFSQALHPTILDFEKQGAGSVPEGHAIHIYRILQEALTNVVRHSKSKEASVRLSYSADAMRLQVEDHGIGIGPRANGGLGLIAMRERAELVGGELDVSRRPDGGTLVDLKVPMH